MNQIGREMARLPALISIPVGRVKDPQQLKRAICLGSEDILNDGDAFERDVYDLGEHVAGMAATGVARSFVDVNCAPNDPPPENPDGIVKTRTCFRRVIQRAISSLKDRLHPGDD
jgi:formiminoglutamase